MKRLLIAAALAAAVASPAAAQVAGTYSGTSADGNGVSFTVATDTGTGKLAITGATIFYSALCKDGSTLGTGWGYGMTQDINKHKVANVTTNPFFVIGFNLVFSADGSTATGNIHSYSPTLSPVNSDPEKALFCFSKSQTMGVTHTGPARVNPPAQAVLLGPQK